MAQVTQSVIDMTKARLDRGEWPNLTQNEYRQLCFAWEELQRLRGRAAHKQAASDEVISPS